jgi:hypothetical protein
MDTMKTRILIPAIGSLFLLGANSASATIPVRHALLHARIERPPGSEPSPFLGRSDGRQIGSHTYRMRAPQSPNKTKPMEERTHRNFAGVSGAR